MPSSPSPDDIEKIEAEKAELAKMLELISIFSALIEGFVEKKKTPLRPISSFTALLLPTVSIKDYLVKRFLTFLKFDENDLIYMLIYLDRYKHHNPTRVINSYNIHRLLAITFYIEQKFLIDEIYKLKFYAKAFGVSTESLHQMEVEFLISIQYDLFINTETFQTYKTEFASYVLSHSVAANPLPQVKNYMEESKISANPVLDEAPQGQLEPLPQTTHVSSSSALTEKQQTPKKRMNSSYCPRLMSPQGRLSKSAESETSFVSDKKF